MGVSRERSRPDRQPWRRLIAALALACVAVPAGASGAAAVEGEPTAPDPLWYMEKMRIPAIHEAGITGEGVTIAVFDGRLNPEVPTLADADIEVREVEGCGASTEVGAPDQDTNVHGTNVTSMIVGNGTSESGVGPEGVAPGAKILYYAIGTVGALESNCERVGTESAESTDTAAVKDAIAQGADIISYSGGSPSDPVTDQDEWAWVTAALQAGVLVVVASPNDNDAMDVALEKTNGVVNVSAVDANADMMLSEWSEEPWSREDVDVAAPGVDVAGIGVEQYLGEPVSEWGMTPWLGNSSAAPIVSSVLALTMQKWPDATPEQLLQSLIRNTGTEPHDLNWNEGRGYGVVNATRMMEEDPSQYPDENPLFKDDQQPTFDEVYAPEPTEGPDAAAAPADAGGSAPPIWLVVIGAVVVGGLLVGGAIAAVVAIVVTRRNTRERAGRAGAAPIDTAEARRDPPNGADTHPDR